MDKYNKKNQDNNQIISSIIDLTRSLVQIPSQGGVDNPENIIKYQLPKLSFVNLSIYNIYGQLVEILINENLEPGYYSIEWDGSKFSSGVYFYRITAGEFLASAKCLLLK